MAMRTFDCIVRDMKDELKQGPRTGLSERPCSDCKQGASFDRFLVEAIVDPMKEKRIRCNEFTGSLFFLLPSSFETAADAITCIVSPGAA